MQCRSCRARLLYTDNYCRKCGAAVEIVTAEVVRVTPGGPVSTLREAALPAVTQGAALIAVGALLRLAVRRLLAPQRAGRGAWPLSHRAAAPVEGEGAIIEELIYYRRVRTR